MPNQLPASRYDAAALQQAAAFNPAILDQMRAWQGHYQPGGRENNLIDRLLVEAGGGPQARLPEQVIFKGAQGDENAVNAITGDVMLRDQMLGELFGGLDQVAFEKFKQGQRQGPPADQMLNPPGSVRKFINNAGAARQNLLDALGP